MTVYVLTGNSITSRTAQLSGLKTQVAQEQAAASRLGEFSKFSSLAQTRIGTVRSISSARFDWHAALVEPRPGRPRGHHASVDCRLGRAGRQRRRRRWLGSSLTGDIVAPAFELTGCTASQDDVARLMSRLRLINGVTRVSAVRCAS